MNIVKPSAVIEVCRVGDHALQNIERAGRTCYKSEKAVTGESAIDFCAMLRQRGHESVIEHESATVRFVVDRGVSHELVRHRLCAFSQESTRYCNYKDEVVFVLPPWVDVEIGSYIRNPSRPLPYNFLKDGRDYFGGVSGLNQSDRNWFITMIEAEKCYSGLLKEGWTPQQARSVLPNSLKTEIVVTANFREWRHIFKLRCAKAAHPQMREVMIPLLAVMADCVPVIFDDLTEAA